MNSTHIAQLVLGRNDVFGRLVAEAVEREQRFERRDGGKRAGRMYLAPMMLIAIKGARPRISCRSTLSRTLMMRSTLHARRPTTMIVCKRTGSGASVDFSTHLLL